MATLITVFTDLDKTVAKIGARGDRIRSSIETEMRRLLIKMEGNVKAYKLSGQVLHRISGELSKSVHADRVLERSADESSGRVVAGKSAPYARMHEYGFQGTESVRAHSRTITQVFGHPISPLQVEVGAHTRTVNMPVRSFLRSTLHEMEGEIFRGLRAAARDAIK